MVNLWFRGPPGVLEEVVTKIVKKINKKIIIIIKNISNSLK